MSVDPAIRFPGESDEYRRARNRLLAAEIELRRTIERVAAQRRALPAGGAVPHDYVFEETADGGGQVRFSLDGAAPHLAHPLNFVVVAKSDPARIGNFAHERGWRNLRLLSSRNNNYNRDYHGESPEGEQSPVLNVFTRDGDRFRHRWATELMFAPRDEGEEPRHVDSIWPIWNVLDMTPGGRGSDPDFPAMQYE